MILCYRSVLLFKSGYGRYARVVMATQRALFRCTVLQECFVAYYSVFHGFVVLRVLNYWIGKYDLFSIPCNDHNVHIFPRQCFSL